MLPCALCKAPTQSPYICPKCEKNLRWMLDDLDELWHQAHGELQPSKSGNGGRSSEPSLGVNINALSFVAGTDILGMLNEWEKLIREECKLTPFERVKKAPDLSKRIESAIAFTQHHLGWLIASEYLSDFSTELKELHKLGMTAARKFMEKQTRIACPSENADGLPCGRLLTIDKDEILETFECRSCHSQWTALRLVAVALSVPGQRVWLDSEAIAQFLNMTEKNVQLYARRNQLPKRGQQYDLVAFINQRKLDLTA